MRSLTIAAIAVAALLMVACGASSDKCTVKTYISPTTATADHSLLAPGNQVQFSAVVDASKNCVFPAVAITPKWTTSDPANTAIDETTGLATCLHPTATPATISVTEDPLFKDFQTATLTCK